MIFHLPPLSVLFTVRRPHLTEFRRKYATTNYAVSTKVSFKADLIWTNITKLIAYSVKKYLHDITSDEIQ